MLAAIFALLPFALFVAADGQCNTGGIQCCNTVTSYDSKAAQNAFNATGLVDVVAVVDAFVGLSCSGVTVIGTSSGCDANQEPVCCENNKYNGLINLGCTPINIKL